MINRLKILQILVPDLMQESHTNQWERQEPTLNTCHLTKKNHDCYIPGLTTCINRANIDKCCASSEIIYKKRPMTTSNWYYLTITYLKLIESIKLMRTSFELCSEYVNAAESRSNNKIIDEIDESPFNCCLIQSTEKST